MHGIFAIFGFIVARYAVAISASDIGDILIYVVQTNINLAVDATETSAIAFAGAGTGTGTVIAYIYRQTLAVVLANLAVAIQIRAWRIASNHPIPNLAGLGSGGAFESFVDTRSLPRIIKAHRPLQIGTGDQRVIRKKIIELGIRSFLGDILQQRTAVFAFYLINEGFDIRAFVIIVTLGVAGAVRTGKGVVAAAIQFVVLYVIGDLFDIGGQLPANRIAIGAARTRGTRAVVYAILGRKRAFWCFASIAYVLPHRPQAHR